MNREERRALKQKLRPTALRIVALEKKIKAGIDKEACEQEIAEIVHSLTMIEMLAIEDYIYSKHLLD